MRRAEDVAGGDHADPHAVLFVLLTVRERLRRAGPGRVPAAVEGQRLGRRPDLAVPVDRVVRVGVRQDRAERCGRIQHGAERFGAEAFRTDGQERLQSGDRAGLSKHGFRHGLSECKIGTSLLG